MLPPLASPEDLTVHGPDEATDLSKLRLSSTLVRSYVGTDYVDDAGELLPDIPDAVVLVTLSAAERALVNPRGLTGEQVGQYSYQMPAGGGGVYLTKSEKAMLRDARGASGIGSIRFESDLPGWYGGTVWVPVTDGGDAVPYETED